MLGIWQLSESTEQLLGLLDLNEQEKILYANLKREKRKIEWLAARVLLKELINETHIDYDEWDKPFLKNKSWHISISHSGSYVAVIINLNTAVGIDIQLITKKITLVANKFMNETELDTLTTINYAEQLHVFWCAKEALYKLYGKKELSFKADILIAPFEYKSSGEIVGTLITPINKLTIPLRYQKLNNYILVYTTVLNF